MANTPPIEENQELTETSFGNWDHDRLLNAAEKSKFLRALFTNQFFVQPDGQHLRMSFGERVDGEPLFHTCIVVPNSDALEFGQLLVAMAQNSIEHQLAAMKQMLAEEAKVSSDGE
jgi:hypothetical protein